MHQIIFSVSPELELTARLKKLKRRLLSGGGSNFMSKSFEIILAKSKSITLKGSILSA